MHIKASTAFAWFFGAIASCILAHLTLGAVGLDSLIHITGQKISAATGINLSAAFGAAQASGGGAAMAGCAHTGTSLASEFGAALGVTTEAAETTAATFPSLPKNLPVYDLGK